MDTDWDAFRSLARQRPDEYYRSVPGLRSKAFIINPDTQTHGGMYVWDSRADLDAFLATDVYRGIIEGA